jgi:hypothetical protein
MKHGKCDMKNNQIVLVAEMIFNIQALLSSDGVTA